MSASWYCIALCTVTFFLSFDQLLFTLSYHAALLFGIALNFFSFTLGLKDILRQAIISDDSIATILLSKTRDALHDIFSAPSGWHFIGCSIVIRPPNEQAREEIMRALLKRMSCKVTENSELRLESILSYHFGLAFLKNYFCFPSTLVYILAIFLYLRCFPFPRNVYMTSNGI